MAATEARLKIPSSQASPKAHGKTAAQVMLRWVCSTAARSFPKSTKPSRIKENIDVLDFELSAEEMAAIDGLGMGHRRTSTAEGFASAARTSSWPLITVSGVRSSCEASATNVRCPQMPRSDGRACD